MDLASLSSLQIRPPEPGLRLIYRTHTNVHMQSAVDWPLRKSDNIGRISDTCVTPTDVCGRTGRVGVKTKI